MSENDDWWRPWPLFSSLRRGCASGEVGRLCPTWGVGSPPAFPPPLAIFLIS